MNERIRELHSQCKVCDKDTVLYFDYERFAELIVRECDRYAKSAWEHGPLLGRDLLIHFGIVEAEDNQVQQGD